jgi:hypothetical protein
MFLALFNNGGTWFDTRYTQALDNHTFLVKLSAISLDKIQQGCLTWMADCIRLALHANRPLRIFFPSTLVCTINLVVIQSRAKKKTSQIYPSKFGMTGNR